MNIIANEAMEIASTSTVAIGLVTPNHGRGLYLAACRDIWKSSVSSTEDAAAATPESLQEKPASAEQDRPKRRA